MTTLLIAWKAATGEVQILPAGTAIPAGFVTGGTFDHDPANEAAVDVLDTSENHVLFQHVRDSLYKLGEQNMQRIKITFPTVAVTGVTLAPTTLALGVGKYSAPLVPTVAPTGNTNKAVTWTTSDATKATVSSSGIVKGIAAGTATITVHTTDGAKTATCVVTVS